MTLDGTKSLDRLQGLKWHCHHRKCFVTCAFIFPPLPSSGVQRLSCLRPAKDRPVIRGCAGFRGVASALESKIGAGCV